MQFVCAVCTQAMALSVDNVPSQQAVKLVVVGLGLLISVGLDCFGRPVAVKNGVSWGDGFAIGDTNTKNCPLKCLIFETNEESFKTDVSIK